MIKVKGRTYERVAERSEKEDKLYRDMVNTLQFLVAAFDAGTDLQDEDFEKLEQAAKAFNSIVIEVAKKCFLDKI